MGSVYRATGSEPYAKEVHSGSSSPPVNIQFFVERERKGMEKLGKLVCDYFLPASTQKSLLSKGVIGFGLLIISPFIGMARLSGEISTIPYHAIKATHTKLGAWGSVPLAVVLSPLWASLALGGAFGVFVGKTGMAPLMIINAIAGSPDIEDVMELHMGSSLMVPFEPADTPYIFFATYKIDPTKDYPKFVTNKLLNLDAERLVKYGTYLKKYEPLLLEKVSDSLLWKFYGAYAEEDEYKDMKIKLSEGNFEKLRKWLDKYEIK